jgi:hypothetical protein
MDACCVTGHKWLAAAPIRNAAGGRRRAHAPLPSHANFARRANPPQLISPPNQWLPLAVPFPRRGAARDRHGRWERDAMDAHRRAQSLRGRTAFVRTAKSCGPGAPMQALSSLVSMSPATDGGNQAWSPRRSRISRKAIAQGRPDDPPVPVVLPRAFLLHADHGCGGHPAFPAPSCFARVDRFQRLGHFVSRERSLTSPSAVMPRFKRGIQYAAASPPKHRPPLEYLIVRSYPIESGTGAGRRR